MVQFNFTLLEGPHSVEVHLALFRLVFHHLRHLGLLLDKYICQFLNLRVQRNSRLLRCGVVGNAALGSNLGNKCSRVDNLKFRCYTGKTIFLSDS